MSTMTMSMIMLTVVAIAAGILVYWERRHHKKP